MRDTERERQRQREKQDGCGEPDAGLDSQTPGSLPEWKAEAQPLSHPNLEPKCSKSYLFLMVIIFILRG